jgi:hypothetical protein
MSDDRVSNVAITAGETIPAIFKSIIKDPEIPKPNEMFITIFSRRVLQE